MHDNATHLKVDVPFFQEGDVVRVIDDMVQVFSLQDGHGEWNDDMSLVSFAFRSTYQHVQEYFPAMSGN